MQSRAHALIGTVVSALLLVPQIGSLSLPAALGLVGYGVALSVLFDLDHFLVARLLVGDWRHLRRVLAQPRRVLLEDQSWIFEDLQDFPLERLLSHALLGGWLVASLALVDRWLAVFTAVVLYAHVLADLLHDNEVV